METSPGPYTLNQNSLGQDLNDNELVLLGFSFENFEQLREETLFEEPVFGVGIDSLLLPEVLRTVEEGECAQSL